MENYTNFHVEENLIFPLKHKNMCHKTFYLIYINVRAIKFIIRDTITNSQCVSKHENDNKGNKVLFSWLAVLLEFITI